MTASADAIRDAYDSIKEEGVLVTIRRPSTAVAATGAKLTNTYASTTGYALFRSVGRSRSRMDETATIRSNVSTGRGSQIALVAGYGLSFDPRPGDQMYIGTSAPAKPWRVVDVDTVMPDGVSKVLHRCTVEGT